MKKIILSILILLSIFSLTGCENTTTNRVTRTQLLNVDYIQSNNEGGYLYSIVLSNKNKKLSMESIFRTKCRINIKNTINHKINIPVTTTVITFEDGRTITTQNISDMYLQRVFCNR